MGNEVEYRIDELARVAGTTVRNVRVYQEKGILAPPERSGRVGIYRESHLARLRLISQLLARGYTFAHIAELIAAWEHGRDLRDVLGLEAALTSPWVTEATSTFSAAELLRLFGGQATPANIGRAVSMGLLVRRGPRFETPSARLLRAGAELVAAGIPLADVLDLAEQLAGDMDTTAGRLVQIVTGHVLAGRPPGWLPSGDEVPKLAALIERLRPLAGTAVEVYLGHALEARMRGLIGDRIEAHARARVDPAPGR